MVFRANLAEAQTLDLDAYDAQNDEDFLGEVSDTLSVLSVVVGNIRAKAVDTDEGAKRLLAECGNLQRICASADQPFIEQAVRRLHRYIDFMNQVTDQRLTDIEQFIDVLTGILDGEIDVSGSEAEFVRSLPVLRPLDIEDLADLGPNVRARASQLRLSGQHRVVAVRRPRTSRADGSRYGDFVVRAGWHQRRRSMPRPGRVVGDRKHSVFVVDQLCPQQRGAGPVA